MVSEAIINPAMMIWARRYAGFIEEYEELLPGYIKKHYKLWENGEKYPTWNQLRQVSNKYNVPTAFFFMETEPDFDDLPTLINFRKIDPDNYKNESPELIKEIRKSEHRREIYLDLLFDLDKPIPKFEVIEESKSRRNVVKYIREKLGISLDEQKSWIRKNNSLDKEHYNFLNKWKEIITEKMGILIFETDGVILEEMRGLCIFHEEQASSTLIPEGELKPGHLYSVGPSESGKLGVYKFETEMLKGNGKFTPNGIGSKKDVNEAVKIAYQYFKSNASSISGQISYKDKDYVMQVKVGMTNQLTLATFIALCSVATNRQVLPSLAILGNFSLGGTVEKVQNLADALQVCLDNGAKKILVPMSSYVDIGLVPPDLLVKFTMIPYNTSEEAVMKAFGIE